MSSSNGKSFTGTALVVLALFGVGGAVVDKMRGSGDEAKPVETIQTTPKTETGMSEYAKQKPGFEIINLSRDGTGTLEGRAAPGANIILFVDGKAEKVGVVGENGNFSLGLDKSLAEGKHILKIKTVGPKNKEPVTSDHSIEVNVAKGREAVVALLQKGKPRQVLQGVEDKEPASAPPVKEDEKPVVKTPESDNPNAKQATSPHSTDVANQAMDKPAAKDSPTTKEMPAAKEVAAAKDAPAAKDIPATKPQRRDLSFGEMKFVEGEGNSGEVNIAGMAQAGAKIRFLMDGKKIGETVADKAGNWSLRARQELTPGAHWLVAEQLDEKGEIVVKAEAPFDRAEPPAKQVAKKASGDKPAVPAFDALASMKKAMSSSGKKPETLDAPNAEQKKVAALETDGQNGNKNDTENIWDRFKGIFKVEPGKEQGESKPFERAGGTQTDTQKPAQGGSAKSFSFGSLTFKDGTAGGALELTGHAEPGSRVRLFQGSQEIGEVIANNEGFWTFTKKGEIKSGMHLFRAGHVLKSGRITAEARMQYDHVTPARAAQLRKRGEESDQPASDAKSAPEVADGAGTGPENKIEPFNNRTPSNDMQGTVVASNQKQAEDKAVGGSQKPEAADIRSGPDVEVLKPGAASAGRQAVRPDQAEKATRGVKKARAKRWSSQSFSRKTKMRKRKMRRARRNIRRAASLKRKRARAAKRKRNSSLRRTGGKRSINRYTLGKRNKARYMAKRRKYPRSRKTPTRVRVRKGTTLWGYSQHYYGRGRLYPRIHRANRTKIKNPNKIFSGQRIRVPGVKRKKRRHR